MKPEPRTRMTWVHKGTKDHDLSLKHRDGAEVGVKKCTTARLNILDLLRVGVGFFFFFLGFYRKSVKTLKLNIQQFKIAKLA